MAASSPNARCTGGRSARRWARRGSADTPRSVRRDSNRSWFFAEGAAAPGFETFYLVFNPHPTHADVFDANFFTEAAGLVPARLHRATRRTPDDLPERRARQRRRHRRVPAPATRPFVAERSIYWGPGRVEGTSTRRRNDTCRRRWDLPEGAAGGNFDTFLLLGQPVRHASDGRHQPADRGLRPDHAAAVDAQGGAGARAA